MRDGLELGYRAIDTAQIYGNEAEVGQAIAESGVPRDELFLTTKIWTENLGRDRLVASLKESLAKLRTDHVDLTLIHWPSPGRRRAAGRVHGRAGRGQGAGARRRLIGVSNFTIALLREAIAAVGARRDRHQPGRAASLPAEPQAGRRSPASQGIHLTSYMTLAYGKVLNDPVMAAHRAGARRHAGAGGAGLGDAAGPCGDPVVDAAREPASNLEARKLRLTDDEMARIAALDRNERVADPAGLAPAWD